MRYLNDVEISAVSGSASLGGYTFSDMLSNALLFGSLGWLCNAPFLAGAGIGAGYVGLGMIAGGLDNYLELHREPLVCSVKRTLEEPAVAA